MKQAKSVPVASWLLKHFTFGLHREALAGDLSEELQSGRSTIWYWRQVLSAIAVGVIRNSRSYVLALIFSTAWCTLYPAWQLCLAKINLAQIMPHRWATIDLPYSTGLHGIAEIIPAILFIWLGLFFYLMLRTEKPSQLSALRLFASLSLSLNIFFMATIAIRIHLKPSGIGLGNVSRENPISTSHLIALSVPLALGLFSAIAAALPPSHHRGTAPLPG